MFCACVRQICKLSMTQPKVFMQGNARFTAHLSLPRADLEFANCANRRREKYATQVGEKYAAQVGERNITVSHKTSISYITLSNCDLE